MASHKKSGAKSGSSSNQRKKHKGGPKAILFDDLKKRMESCPTAEQLNEDVVTPFMQALVTVCDARGYVLNIYGENCNLAITPEDHAEALFHLIEDYLDQSGLG